MERLEGAAERGTESVETFSAPDAGRNSPSQMSQVLHNSGVGRFLHYLLFVLFAGVQSFGLRGGGFSLRLKGIALLVPVLCYQPTVLVVPSYTSEPILG